MKDYQAFLRSKGQRERLHGFKPLWMPDFLYDFQRFLTDWAVRKGRAAMYADCGTGKTPMQLVWAQNVVQHTNKPVLIVTPLAVSAQTIREGEKFGIECRRSKDGRHGPGITITNYERLHHFSPDGFAGVVCDESSAIKHFEGQRQKVVTEFMRTMPYRLLCTATAAPNDYIELGTSAEALGELGRMDMLAQFFKNDENSLHPIWWGARWRFKHHAERAFWRWVCSWARAMRKPSDYGFEDGDFVLPPLETRETVIGCSRPRKGTLLVLPAVTLEEQREERRVTLEERCGDVADKVNHTGEPAVVWCHLNKEADLLEKLIPDALQVAGRHSDDVKEERFLAFSLGQLRVMVIKPKIGAFGLNWQHCSHVTVFPSHSFEQFYQAIRRCWRFGQKKKVMVDIVTTEGELGVLKNLQRKADAADKMFSMLIAEMKHEMTVQQSEDFPDRVRLPSWLGKDGKAATPGDESCFVFGDVPHEASVHPVRDTSIMGKDAVGMSRTAWGNYNVSGKRGPNPH